MTQPRYGIVVTTINGGEFVPSYLANIREFGHLQDTRLYVVGDRKTPSECRAAVEAGASQGLDVMYLGEEEQRVFLRDYPQLDKIVPWNSDNRRNVGFIMALRDGVETLISIDDDNLPVPGHDFVGGHSVVGQTVTAPAVRASNCWYNLFEALEYTPAIPIWPRGYPYARRQPDVTEVTETTGPVHINAGLWLGDPDVDAITRIAIHPDVQRAKVTRGILAADTYSPINTQNTAIYREAVPAYYYVLMHEPMHGSRLNRFGDIWSGYFVQKCAKTLGHLVAFGDPLVSQVRNEHDLFVDLREEYWGIRFSEGLSDWLTSVRLGSSDYSSLLGELADKLLTHIRENTDKDINDEVRCYFEKVNGAVHAWLETVALIRS